MNNIEQISLDNGMVVMIRRNPATPTASFAFRIAMGSLDDPVTSIGLADLAAPLFTKGTSAKTAREIAEQIDSLGLELSFSSGRHTSMLHGRVISEKIPAAMKLCRELLEDSTPNKEEVDRMKQRMLTGLTMQLDDPAAVATDKMRELIYGNEHPYGHSIRQQIEGLQSVTDTMIIDYCRTTIKPGAIRGVIVGDIEGKNLNSMLNKTFSSWDTGGDFSIATFESVDHPAEPVTDRILLPGKTQSDIALGWQGISRTNPDYYALLAGNTALGRIGLGGRIGQRVREDEGMAYYAYANFNAGIGAGPYAVRAGVNPKHVNRTIEIILEELLKAKSEGLTAEELRDSVTYLAGSLARQMETNSGLASVLLNQDLFKLGDDYYRRFPDILSNLSLDEVNEALNRHLQPEHYCCAIAGPEE